MPVIRTPIIAFGLFVMLMAAATRPRAETVDRAVPRAILTPLVDEERELADAESTWEPSYLPIALEALRLNRNRGATAVFMRITRE